MSHFQQFLNKLWQALAAIIVITVLGGLPAHAQNAQVSGQIHDASQAAISGAKVTLIHIESGDHREITSSNEGYYSFPLLLPGHYELKVEKDGFAAQTQTGILVQAASVSTVDVTLKIGADTQTVSVDASVPLLQSETSSIAHVVDNKTITNMPLLDRRSAQLQRLNGFVVPTGSGANVTFSTGGGRGDNANYLIDGGTAVNLLIGVPYLNFDPPVESVQEFNVATSNYAAELGRSSGAVVQMTTKSGTNSFHGSAYEYFRNNALAATPYFATTNPPLHYNLFGVSLGGPIIKDKTHFFFNYEGRRQNSSVTQTALVPSPAEIGGDFSADSNIIYDPQTGLPFPGNVIPSTRFDPIGSKLASLYPAPNVPGQNLFRANDPTTGVVDDYVARIDHVFNDNNRIFGRLLAQTDYWNTSPIFPSGVDSYTDYYKEYYYSASGTWFHNFSPTWINELRLTFTRRQYLDYGLNGNNSLGPQLAIPGVDQSFFPTVTVSGLDSLAGLNLSGEQERFQTPITSNSYEDNVSWLHGKHQVKFGFAWRTSTDGDLYYPTAGGEFDFNNLATSNPADPGSGGEGLASLLLGQVYQGSRIQVNHLHTVSANWGAFVQDDWRVTPTFTLNVGLRWDLDEPRRESTNQQNSFDPTAINPVSSTPGVVTFAGQNGASIYSNKWDWDNFGPRLGFSWKPKDNWVVRGGGAVLYLGEYDQPMPIALSLGFSTSGDFISPGGVAPAFQLSNGLPNISAPVLNSSFGAVPVGQSPTTAVTYVDPNHPNGYIEQTSLDIQHEFGNNFLIDVGYLGAFGHHLPSPNPVNINQVPTNLLGPGDAQTLRPFPQFSNVQQIADPYGNSTYHGANVNVQKKYSNGLLFQANYTFAKLIDNVTSRADLGASNVSYSNLALLNYYDPASARGLSGNDIRHRFVLSTVYDLPVGEGKWLHPGSSTLNQVVGGWSVGVITEAYTGTPLSPIELVNSTNSFSQGNRPDLVGDPNLSGSRSRSAQLAEWFNTAAFAAPAPFTFGNAPRTFGTGPGAFNLDASLLKDFHVGERSDLQFRLEALNALNHANFANPDTRQGSPTFGQITSLYAGTPARIIQLGLHLAF